MMAMAHTLSCPFISGEDNSSCCATAEWHAPSAFERGEYCLGSRYVFCPFYCSSAGGQYPASKAARRPFAGDAAGRSARLRSNPVLHEE